jgi:serine/threonine protein kinase
MRFVPGDDTDGRATRPADLRPLLTRFVSLCSAAAYAHARGVVHRDIKPCNIAIGDFGEAILLDWGLAQVVGVTEPRDDPTSAPYDRFETHTGEVMGTPGCMAPEQAAGGRVGLAADIDSLCLTLKAMLPADAPAAQHAIAAKAAAPEAKHRDATASDLVAKVERWMADESVTAHRDCRRDRLRRWVAGGGTRPHPPTAVLPFARCRSTGRPGQRPGTCHCQDHGRGAGCRNRSRQRAGLWGCVYHQGNRHKVISLR